MRRRYIRRHERVPWRAGASQPVSPMLLLVSGWRMYPWRPVDHARSVRYLGRLVPDHLEGGRPCQRLHHNHLVSEGRRTFNLKLALRGRLACGFARPAVVGSPRGRRAAPQRARARHHSRRERRGGGCDAGTRRSVAGCLPQCTPGCNRHFRRRRLPSDSQHRARRS